MPFCRAVDMRFVQHHVQGATLIHCLPGRCFVSGAAAASTALTSAPWSSSMSSRHRQLSPRHGSCRRQRRQPSMQVRVCCCSPGVYRVLGWGDSLSHAELATVGIVGFLHGEP